MVLYITLQYRLPLIPNIIFQFFFRFFWGALGAPNGKKSMSNQQEAVVLEQTFQMIPHTCMTDLHKVHLLVFDTNLNIVRDGQTDRRTDGPSYRDASLTVASKNQLLLSREKKIRSTYSTMGAKTTQTGGQILGILILFDL